MDDCHRKRQEEYHQDLAAYRTFDLAFAHSYLLHDLIAFSVIKAFGNLFVINDQHRCHQEQASKIHSNKKHTAIQTKESLFFKISSLYASMFKFTFCLCFQLFDSFQLLIFAAP